MNEFKFLNGFYKNLMKKIEKVRKTLVQNNLVHKMSFYNMHETKINNKYEVEYFPLPELDVEGITKSCSIGITFDYTYWCELTLSRQEILEFDFQKLKDLDFDVYGCQDYLIDFYDEKMEIKEIEERIMNSSEQEIHISFTIKNFSEKWLKKIIDIFS